MVGIILYHYKFSIELTEDEKNHLRTYIFKGITERKFYEVFKTFYPEKLSVLNAE